MYMFSKNYLAIIFSLLLYNLIKSQNLSLSAAQIAVPKKNVGVVYKNDAIIQNGYTLLAPASSSKTFLIDNNGKLVNQWSSDFLPGQSAYLTEDGCLIRTCKINNTKFKWGGVGGRLEKKDWNDQLIWEWELNDSNKCLHHDIALLPNGNILVVLVERKFLKDVLKIGRDTSKLSDKELWTESVLEIKPKGKNEASIVWQWNSWDHFTQNKYNTLPNYSIAEEHPELIDVNYNLELNSTADFLHFNSIAFNPQLNQILLSVRNFSEIWIIDHSTNSLQAKSHKGGKCGKGGDLIYRWGNAKASNVNDAAILDGQHCATWLKKGYINEGKIALFDNRATSRNSRVLIISTPINTSTFAYNTDKKKSYLPSEIIWNYSQPSLSEGRGGGVQGLTNGNILICETSKGKLTEITMNNDTAWMYVIPISADGALTQGAALKNRDGMFKSEKYSSSFKGFEGKKLVSGATLELNPEMLYGKIEITPGLDTIKPNDFKFTANNKYLLLDEKILLFNEPISVFNAQGQLIDKQTIKPQAKWYLGLYKEGLYYFECKKRYFKVSISK